MGWSLVEVVLQIVRLCVLKSILNWIQRTALWRLEKMKGEGVRGGAVTKYEYDYNTTSQQE
jgi:lysozyme family protein